MKSATTLRHILVGLFAMVVLVLVASFGPGISQASASCRHTVDPGFVGDRDEPVGPPYGWEMWTIVYTVPSWSTCHDINISHVRNEGQGPNPVRFRVRFYPSSGGSYVNSWKIVPPNSATLYPIATSVGDGTKYRVEWLFSNLYAYQTTYFHIWD